MDVLLARDGDLLRLIFKILNVVVDVENVLIQLGKVMELWKKDRRECSSAVVNYAESKTLCFL